MLQLFNRWLAACTLALHDLQVRRFIHRGHRPSLCDHFQRVNRGIAEGELAAVAIDTPEDMVDENIAEPTMGHHYHHFSRVPSSNRL
jgi:hypothetical protein